jgi:putative tryptophan/tyrosine transport system substrate-binding protein
VDVREIFRRAAIFVDKFLKGAKPGDPPDEQATKIQLIINLKTAKALPPHDAAVAPSARGRGDSGIERSGLFAVFSRLNAAAA